VGCILIKLIMKSCHLYLNVFFNKIKLRIKLIIDPKSIIKVITSCSRLVIQTKL